MLDTHHDGLCFHAWEASFPRPSAWENLERALRGATDQNVWDHLAGTKSKPFEPGEHGQAAMKAISDRGNELLVVKSLEEAEQ